MSELESVRIGKCQNWKVSALESVRIGKCQNWKVSELEGVRIICSLKIPYKWDKYCLSSNLSTCHGPVDVSYALICIIMVTQASFAPYLKNLQILTLSNSDTFRFWHFPILTLSNSDTFQFWHFPILTLSNSDTFQFLPKWAKIGFWHVPILTLSNPR